MIQSRYARNLTGANCVSSFTKKTSAFKKCISYFPTTEIAFVSLLFLLLFMTLWSELLPRIVIVLHYLTFWKRHPLDNVNTSSDNCFSLNLNRPHFSTSLESFKGVLPEIKEQKVSHFKRDKSQKKHMLKDHFLRGDSTSLMGMFRTFDN